MRIKVSISFEVDVDPVWNVPTAEEAKRVALRRVKGWFTVLGNDLSTEPTVEVVADCAHQRIVYHEEDETFYGRRGCLDCGEWLDKVRLKRP